MSETLKQRKARIRAENAIKRNLHGILAINREKETRRGQIFIVAVLFFSLALTTFVLTFLAWWGNILVLPF